MKSTCQYLTRLCRSSERKGTVRSIYWWDRFRGCKKDKFGSPSLCKSDN